MLDAGIKELENYFIGASQNMSVRQQLTPSDRIAAQIEPPPRNCVLVLVGTYLPGYKAGGPLRSIANLVATLGLEFHFRIVTLDRDHREKSPFPGVVTNRWVRIGQADVMYLRPGLRGFLSTYALLRSVDRNTVLYLNSFFSPRFSMLPVLVRWLKLCRPRSLVLAPRGEFSLGALGIKRLQEFLYLRMSRGLGLYHGAIWQASSDFEVQDIRRQFPEARSSEAVEQAVGPASSWMRSSSVIMTAIDLLGAAPPRSQSKPGKRAGELRVVFVGRCSRMKNLSGALKLLAGVLGDVSFDLYGPVEDAEYWHECQGIISALPPNIRVRNNGEIEHKEVARVFSEHDLFLFPTLGENFGHVIGEAMMSGCPVLISDRTPWRNLQAEGVGWDIPLGETERFRSVLQQCVDGGSEWLAALSNRAQNYAVKRACDPVTIEANRKLFKLACDPLRPETNL
jgi:glycosyltransferase involved in cell wall biosynthesis